MDHCRQPLPPVSSIVVTGYRCHPTTAATTDATGRCHQQHRRRRRPTDSSMAFCYPPFSKINFSGQGRWPRPPASIGWPCRGLKPKSTFLTRGRMGCTPYDTFFQKVRGAQKRSNQDQTIAPEILSKYQKRSKLHSHFAGRITEHMLLVLQKSG